MVKEVRYPVEKMLESIECIERNLAVAHWPGSRQIDSYRMS